MVASIFSVAHLRKSYDYEGGSEGNRQRRCFEGKGGRGGSDLGTARLFVSVRHHVWFSQFQVYRTCYWVVFWVSQEFSDF